MYPGNRITVCASAYCRDISSTFSCSTVLFMNFGALSRSAWNILSNVKFVMRIEGILRELARRHGRHGASEIIAWILFCLRKWVSSVCAREGSKFWRECSDCSPSSWYAFLCIILGCNAYVSGVEYSGEDVRM